MARKNKNKLKPGEARMKYIGKNVITASLRGYKDFIFSPGEIYVVPAEIAYIRTLIRKQYLIPVPGITGADKPK